MRVLVTGGAGFIGSTLADALLGEGHRVRVLDDLSSGFPSNVPADAHLVQGSVADEKAVSEALDGTEVVFHLAAQRAVLRSLADPIATNTVNAHGTVTVLKAALDAGVRRVVYASSSSVYGTAALQPTPETAPALPLSPYGVSKLAAEHYCRVFAELHDLETVVLRYFNVFGPRQRPDSPYAAAIPLFIAALRSGEPPVVHGDGGQSRAFTYVDDAVAATLAAARATPAACRGQAYNVAGPESFTVLQVLEVLGCILGVDAQPVHADPRDGDIRHSAADISAAARELGYSPRVGFEHGLRHTLAWFLESPPADALRERAAGRPML